MIQATEFRILSRFLWQNSRRFAELCRAVDLPTDLGGYYIRGLVKGGFLTRSDRGTYTITPKGKQELVIRHDAVQLVSRPRLCVMIIARQEDKFVVLERTKQPFIDAVEWPAGAVMNGEEIPAAAERILFERFDIKGLPTSAGMFRRIDIYQGAVFDDKLFALHTFSIPKGGQIKEGGRTGKNVRFSHDELHLLSNSSKSLLDILAYITAHETALQERVYTLEKSDLFLGQ